MVHCAIFYNTIYFDLRSVTDQQSLQFKLPIPYVIDPIFTIKEPLPNLKGAASKSDFYRFDFAWNGFLSD